MATLTIKGVLPLDGDYPLDIGQLSNGDLHTIKEISGVRAGEFQEAMAAADNDLVVAFAVIALRRAGKQVNADAIWDAELGAITIDFDDAPVEPRPPTSASPNGNANGDAGSDAHNANTSPSGEGSVPTGEIPPNDPSRTGLPGSEDSAASGPETSAS